MLLCLCLFLSLFSFSVYLSVIHSQAYSFLSPSFPFSPTKLRPFSLSLSPSISHTLNHRDTLIHSPHKHTHCIAQSLTRTLASTASPLIDSFTHGLTHSWAHSLMGALTRYYPAPSLICSLIPPPHLCIHLSQSPLHSLTHSLSLASTLFRAHPDPLARTLPQPCHLDCRSGQCQVDLRQHGASGICRP